MTSFTVNELRKLITMLNEHMVHHEKTMSAEGINYLKVSVSRHTCHFPSPMYFTDGTPDVARGDGVRHQLRRQFPMGGAHSGGREGTQVVTGQEKSGKR